MSWHYCTGIPCSICGSTQYEGPGPKRTPGFIGAFGDVSIWLSADANVVFSNGRYSLVDAPPDGCEFLGEIAGRRFWRGPYKEEN